MIGWIRTKLGLCPHRWTPWKPFYECYDSNRFMADAYEVGRQRECMDCHEIQKRWHPDGH
jgi:hypothetical protein